MVAWDSLYSYFEGGFKYIFTVISGHYETLTPIRYYSDEAYLAFDLLLESYYLYKHNWLYSENFFSFTRSALSKDENKLVKFSGKHKTLVLLYEVVLPYLRLKLHKWYQAKQQDSTDLPFDKKYLKLIPILNGSYAFIDFLYKLKFLVQKDFRYFKPYLHFWNFLIRRKNTFEVKQEEESYSNGFFSLLSKYNIFLIFLFVKYWQWYFSQSNVNQSTNQLENDICPPPTQTGRYSKGWAICKKDNIENPWALETSGYVFCFMCIQAHVEKYKKWPITKAPSAVGNIRKIYA